MQELLIDVDNENKKILLVENGKLMKNMRKIREEIGLKEISF